MAGFIILGVAAIWCWLQATSAHLSAASSIQQIYGAIYYVAAAVFGSSAFVCGYLSSIEAALRRAEPKTPDEINVDSQQEIARRVGLAIILVVLLIVLFAQR